VSELSQAKDSQEPRREVLHPDEADKRVGYHGWSTGWLANYRIFDGHHWVERGDHWDGAICRDCGTARTNAQIARGEVGRCAAPAEGGADL